MPSAAATAALSVASTAAFATPTYVSTTNSLTGEVIITGMADLSPTTFDVTLRDLNGTVQVVVPPNGNYAVNYSGFCQRDARRRRAGHDPVGQQPG